jgi:hypothetical protein
VRRSVRAVASALAAAVLFTAACAAQQPVPDREVRIDWQPATLPLPSGDPGRAAPRDAVRCGGTWYVAGAVIAPDGGIRPAVWRSPDAVGWAEVRLEPLSYYGRQNILYSIGCRDGRVAAVGAKSGGVHGNPRIATWYQRDDGSLVEVLAQFTLYGGEDAVGVSRLAGGPPGWLISGNRVSGAAAWVSPDAAEFTLVEFAGKIGTAGTTAADGAAGGAGWLVVGSVLARTGVGRDAAAWTSTDGRDWTPVTLPQQDGDDALLRVVPLDGGLVAAGVRGDTFGIWRERGGTWQATDTFGAARGRVAAGVGGITRLGDALLVTTEAEAGRALWVGDGSGWHHATIPGGVPPGGDTALTVVGADGTVLLVSDDGRSGGVWRAGGVN